MQRKMSNLYGTPANAYMVDPSISDQLPSIVKVALSQMNVEKQSMFVEEYKRKRVDLTVIVLLSIFFRYSFSYSGKQHSASCSFSHSADSVSGMSSKSSSRGHEVRSTTKIWRLKSCATCARWGIES